MRDTVRQTLTLGRLLDIRVGVHVSWLAVYAFMTVALARLVGTLPIGAAYAFGAICALTLFASVVAHEFAHALVARRFGVRTAAITLFLLGGVATLEEEPPTPRADAWIAVAGPAMSALLAAVFFALTFAVDRYVPGSVDNGVGLLVTYVAVANTVLAVFNLIPAYPMDGGRILRALVWRRWDDRRSATLTASRVGMAFAVAFVVLGVALVAVNRDVFSGWTAVLGAFLFRQGWAYERAERRMRCTDVEVGAAA